MPRSLAPLLAALLAACPSEDGGTEGPQGSSGGSTGAVTTGSTGAMTTTSPTTTGGPPGDDKCPMRPSGDWAACEKNGVVDNSACGWMDDGQSGELTCLSPASGGGYNVCAIKGCVDDCDCFTPPATGDAVVFCADLGGGDKACTLYCAGGQTCPDGMSCQSGYCFWDG